LVLVVFLFLSLSWAEKTAKDNKQSWLGVYLQELTSELKESLDMDEATEGVLISGVVKGSPAEEGGLEDRDVIISFNGKRVLSVDDLTRLVREASPGTEVELKIVRDGEKKSIMVTLGESSSSSMYNPFPEGLQMEKKKAFPFKMSLFSGLRLGISIQDLTDQLGNYFGVKNGEGVLITEVEKKSPAEQAGLKAGDVIVEVDNRKVDNSEDVVKMVSGREKGDKVNLKILREKKPRDFSITIGKDKEEWSFGMPEIEKLKKIEIYPEKLNPPEPPVNKEYSWDEKELKELKQEMEELKKDVEKLREEMKR
ncbi:MAG: PDZ domain-containing protein, partial [candidate division Zixibacteria bacterium]|nr:PDZ domain-containing protein [candidate division Zixibacteria bacterium]